MPGGSGGRTASKEVSGSLWTAESRAPALTCTDCCSKIYALERRRNKAASWGSPFILTWPVLHCFLCFFSVLTIVWFMALQHGLFQSYGWGWWDWWCCSVCMAQTRKISLNLAETFSGIHGGSWRAGSTTLEDSGGFFCVKNGPLRRSETLSKSDSICWALPLSCFFLDFTFSPRRAKDIYRNIQ